MAVISYTLEVLFSFCLLQAAISDQRTKEVYRFWWWFAKLSALVLCLLRLPQKHCMIEFLIFVFLQRVLFDRFYGRADVHAFISCALLYCANGYGLLLYLLHMGLSLLFLTVSQIMRGNVTAKGRLEEPAAFIPYIAFAFFLLLFGIKSDIVMHV